LLVTPRTERACIRAVQDYANVGWNGCIPTVHLLGISRICSTVKSCNNCPLHIADPCNACWGKNGDELEIAKSIERREEGYQSLAKHHAYWLIHQMAKGGVDIVLEDV